MLVGTVVGEHDTSTPKTTTVVTKDVSQADVVVEETRFTAADERVLRMRHGAGLGPQDRLGSKLDGVHDDVRNEVEAKLLLMEAEILRALADGEGVAGRGQDEASGRVPTDDGRTARIIAALKDKDT